MRLPLEEEPTGWVRLFDGRSQFGWQTVGNVDWHVDQLALRATRGDISLTCTTTIWKDYELDLEFNADVNTNSGIFLRTPLADTDPKTNCYEFNIASSDNPFPTGSLVGRQRVDPSDLGELSPNLWHRVQMQVQGDRIKAQINGKQVLDWTDPEPLPAGFIGLQHNSGRIAFRNVKLRPLGLKKILDRELSHWKQYPNMEGKFVVDADGDLQIIGGKGQLESTDAYGDFVLVTRVRTNAPATNGGLFFRCIPGEELNGYECQISSAFKDDNPLTPTDCGMGGIFRRMDARIVASENRQWADLVLYARGPHVATWVNGLQVTDWTDDRPINANPRRGLRTEPGTLMLQAHDPTTDVSCHAMTIAPLE